MSANKAYNATMEERRDDQYETEEELKAYHCVSPAPSWGGERSLCGAAGEAEPQGERVDLYQVSDLRSPVAARRQFWYLGLL